MSARANRIASTASRAYTFVAESPRWQKLATIAFIPHLTARGDFAQEQIAQSQSFFEFPGRTHDDDEREGTGRQCTGDFEALLARPVKCLRGVTAGIAAPPPARPCSARSRAASLVHHVLYFLAQHRGDPMNRLVADEAAAL